MEIKMIVDNKIYQALVIKELKHEARLSDRQIRVCEWSQFKDGKIKTWRNREVKLSDELYSAIASLPVSGRRVFKVPSSSLTVEMPKCPERCSTPVEKSEKERLAELLAEKLLA